MNDIELERELMAERVIILLDSGKSFEGTIEHWKDCFFSNPTLENIRAFAKAQHARLDFARISCVPEKE